MRKLKVAVLGTGPSAAFAVLACRNSNVTPTVYSSFGTLPTFQGPAGAFYFHKVPGAPVESNYYEHLTIIGVGGKDEYFKKQWGYIGESTFPAEPYTDYGFDPKYALRYMWERQDISKHEPFTDESVAVLARDFDYVFQTFPTDKSRNELGKYKVTFPATVVDVHSTVMLENDLFITPNTIIYDGLPQHSFVRASSLFGKLTREYPIGTKLNTRETVVTVPDLRPECPEWDRKDVPASNVFLLGRWAVWSRHMLSHQAYFDAWEVLNGRR